MEDTGTFTMLTVLYVLLSLGIVLRSQDFVSSGLSIESIFRRFIGRESDNFVFYHIKRSSCTLLVHASLLLGYRFYLSWMLKFPLIDTGFSLYNLLGISSTIMSLTAWIIVYKWKKNNWENHPISKKLALFCDTNTSWRTLASDINIEFRRVEKLTIKCSSLVDVYVTDNWIIKVSSYGLDLAHQSDAKVEVDTADTHSMGTSGTGTVQYLNIRVSFTRRGNHQFYMRLNSMDFKDLEEKIRKPIVVANNLVFYRSKADHFVEVFKEHISRNPAYHCNEELEPCIGCFREESNVKLVQNCNEEGFSPNFCSNCYCRPMWCAGCMGRWFISRQDQDHPESWLSSKCTCPVCRSVFCILDVCPVAPREPN